MEKASVAVLDTERADMIGCPAGSPLATIGSALRGMAARAATSYPPEAQCQGCLWNGAVKGLFNLLPRYSHVDNNSTSRLYTSAGV